MRLKKHILLRKLIGNLLMAFLLFPLLILKRHWSNIINGVYKVEDAYYETFIEYMQRLLRGKFLLSTIFLFLMLFPFQLIKDYFNRKGKPLSLSVKCIIFGLFVMVCYAFLFRGYLGYAMRSDPMSFWGPIILAGIIFPVSLYFLVDRYVERKLEKEE